MNKLLLVLIRIINQCAAIILLTFSFNVITVQASGFPSVFNPIDKTVKILKLKKECKKLKAQENPDEEEIKKKCPVTNKT